MLAVPRTADFRVKYFSMKFVLELEKSNFENLQAITSVSETIRKPPLVKA